MIQATYTARVNKVVTNIIKERVTSTIVSKANQMYKVSPSAEKWQAINFNNTAGAGGQSFTLTSSHSGFYECNNDLFGSLSEGVGAQAIFDFSNGEYSTLQTFVFYDAQIS